MKLIERILIIMDFDINGLSSLIIVTIFIYFRKRNPSLPQSYVALLFRVFIILLSQSLIVLDGTGDAGRFN